MADDEVREGGSKRHAKRAKQAEIDRKRAEVRKRMEEASKAKKAKKGFMTPDRKKKLRLLLRKKAAEELKKEQERKAAERRRIIEERCGHPKNIDDANEDDLSEIVTEYWNKVYKLEGEKFDLERDFRMKAWEIADLNSQVNDLRGKFVKPTLKKVSKYENKFAKLQKKAAEFNFRNQLKVVKKKEFTLEEEDKEKKPDWSKKGDEKKDESEGEGAETESVATEGDLTHTEESDGGAISDADAKSDNALSEAEGATPEPETVLEPVVEEPQPPSPAPEELWTYLKEAVTSNAVVSVDDLVEKLVTTVSSIPQPYLKSVVKESIKKQKSIEEDEATAHADGAQPESGEGATPTDGTEAPPPAEGADAVAPSEGAEVAAPAEGTEPAGGAPTVGDEVPAAPENAAEATPATPAENAPTEEPLAPPVEAAA